MSDTIDLGAWVLENVQKIFFPEEWIALDRDLSKTELLSLLVISRKGDMTMSNLAETLGFALSTATGIVDRLVKNGYVGRERSEADRRIVVIRLTAKGQETVKKLLDTVMSYVQKIQNALSAEEQGQALSLVRKILDVLNVQKTSGEAALTSADLRRISIE